MRNPEFSTVLLEMERLHDRKNQDYAEEGNPYSNFEKAAELAGVKPIDAILTLIGVKTARLAELNKGKTANFEPLEDTLRDLAVYAVIALAYMGAYDAELFAEVRDGVVRLGANEPLPSLKETIEGMLADRDAWPYRVNVADSEGAPFTVDDIHGQYEDWRDCPACAWARMGILGPGDVGDERDELTYAERTALREAIAEAQGRWWDDLPPATPDSRLQDAVRNNIRASEEDMVFLGNYFGTPIWVPEEMVDVALYEIAVRPPAPPGEADTLEGRGEDRPHPVNCRCTPRTWSRPNELGADPWGDQG